MDFAKENQAGVSWTREGTRVLSVKGIPRLEVEEDELGIPVTTKYHVKIPPRYNAVFEVNLHGNCNDTKIISANRQLMEANPNTFQHEILLKPEGNKYFPAIAITNLDNAKMLHLAKGKIVGFAHDEEVEMNYIETANTLEMDEIEQRAPRNWIPERCWRNYRESSEISPKQVEVSEVTDNWIQTGEISPKNMQKLNPHHEPSDEEGFEMDFLISLGDVYPNRKVKLEDAEITMETRKKSKRCVIGIWKHSQRTTKT